MTIGTSYANSTYIDPALYAQQKAALAMQNKAVGATDSLGTNDSFVSTSGACTDGKDDGKIGFFEGVGQFFKGAAKGLVNGVKGMFLDENGKFSLKNTLKTAVTIGACFIPVAGPYIAAGLCAIGVAKGAIGMAKSAVNIATADTDAEAKEAISSLGGSTLATGLSAAGLKGATGAIAKSAGFSSTGAMLKAAKTTAGRANISAGVKNSFSNYYGNAWSANGVKGVLKEGANGTAENVVGTAKAIKQKATDTSNKITGKTGSGNAEHIAKKLSTRGEKVSVEQIQDAINNKGGKLQVGDKTYNLSQAGDDISYALQKTKAKTTAWESTKGTSQTSENLTAKDLVQKYKNNEFQSGDLTSIRNLEANQSITLKNGQVVTKGADGTYTLTTKTNPTLTKTTTYNNVTPEKLNSFKYKQMIKHSNGNVTYSDNTLTFKTDMPTSVAKVNEFIHNNPGSQVNAFAQKVAPNTYSTVSEFVQSHTPQSVSNTYNAIKSFDAKGFVNGIEPAQTVDYNAFIAKAVQDIE